MDQEKIGKFIAKLRNEKQMTQQELADKIGVTDRAISKWENGRGMPDLSLIRFLCDELGITINELLSGERINAKDYQIKFEENVLKTIDYSNKKNKKKQIKIILTTIISFIVLCCVMFLTDMSRVKQLKKPIFCIKNGYMGSMTRFDGLGYNIDLDINATTGEITYGQMTMIGKIIIKSYSENEEDVSR